MCFQIHCSALFCQDGTKPPCSAGVLQWPFMTSINPFCPSRPICASPIARAAGFANCTNTAVSYNRMLDGFVGRG